MHHINEKTTPTEFKHTHHKQPSDCQLCLSLIIDKFLKVMHTQFPLKPPSIQARV